MTYAVNLNLPYTPKTKSFIILPGYVCIKIKKVRKHIFKHFILRDIIKDNQFFDTENQF